MKSALKLKEVKQDLLFSTLALALLLLIFLWKVGEISDIEGYICQNHATYVSLSATLLGFLVTAYTILVAFPTNYKVNMLKKHKNYFMLFDVFYFAINLLVILLALGLIGLIFNIKSFIYCILIVLVMVWSVSCVIRTVKILKDLTDLYKS